MESRNIIVRGAKEHNLRNVSIELPKNKLIVFTGVSGSGKSSLAFDTLYAEGQRRYVESLSNYARQFLGQLPKPDVEYIGGLAPAISIQQKTAGRNPRSTVGTITEVSDYLRVLFARLGQGHCPTCSRPITAQTREQIVGRVLSLPEGARFMVLAPVVRSQKGEFRDYFADMVKRGFLRARVDGKIGKMTDDWNLDKKIKHTIEIVIDRLKVDPKQRVRVAEAVDQALNLAAGSVILSLEGEDEKAKPTDILLSANYACTHCSISYEPPSPQLFSFNSPLGMCLECDGLGTKFTFDPDLVIPDAKISFYNGAVPLVGDLRTMGRWRKHTYEGVGKSLGIDLKLPWKDLPKEHQQLLLYGSGEAHIIWEWKKRGGAVLKHSGKWEGVIPQLMSQFKKTSAGPRRMQLEKYMRVVKCPGCLAERLNPQARAVRVGGKTLIEVGRMPIGELVPWFAGYEAKLNTIERIIAGELMKEIRSRVGFLLNVGLHYLSLDRAAPTLSGGEAQRIRLAGQIGSGLVGVLYILDEPSIGLHARDNERLLRSLEHLRDIGNTVLVVEHDEDTMRAADFLVDFGPGPGVRGGQIVAAGTPAEVLNDPNSVTGQYLTGAKTITGPAERRQPTDKKLRIVGARHNNLKNVTAEIPLGLFVTVTGVSGSGKSSLVNDILKEALLAAGRADNKKESDEEEETLHEVGDHDKLEGTEHIDKVIDIDQTAIGRTPRSNPATYIKVWDEIRILYAAMSDAKVRGYQPGRFSFNVPGGRCEACQGNGSNRLEMDFLADVWITCNVCEGRRFNRETLQVKYRGKSIQEVLELEVAQALEHFEHHAKIHGMLKTLHDVGLDYIKLGQPSPTLSGGEAQRVKLAKELCRKGTGKTLYILDEPTTGLHFEDIRKLLEVLHGFVDQGNTVLVIEHNLDVIRTSDWLIDIGPDGGSGGGEIVAVGTPEAVMKVKASHTGQALLPILQPKKTKTTTVKALKRKPAGDFITHLEVQGATQHNLKNIDARIPREKMTVFSGPSGSGKSSLAMDTIYAEGQRRYVESLSSYARQFLGQVQKPRVEQISGLSPAIAIEQKTTSKSPRSTVGTITEIYDYLRILYARLGERFCPDCQVPMGTQTADQIIEKILALDEGTKLYILAPIERKGQEKYETLFDEIRKAGYVRMRVDGKSFSLDEPPAIDHRRKHDVEVVVDRNVVKPGTRARIAEAVEQALDLGRGVVHLAYVDADKDEKQWKVEQFSQHLACTSCGKSYDVLNPHNYSFNSSLGWCPTCEGLGFQRGANLALLIRDGSLSLREGAIAAWPELGKGSPFLPFAEAIAKEAGFDLDTPFDDLEPEQQRAILQGTGDKILPLGTTSHGFQYKGLYPTIDEASRVSFMYRMKLDQLVDEVPCNACQGSRLRRDAAATKMLNLTLGEMTNLPLGESYTRLKAWKLSVREKDIIGEVLREILARLKFLVDVGLEYLGLDRKGPTLSGGEAQRIRLASQIGSGLTGVMYVLDEPTIGLHPRDNARLLGALQRLRDLGNTLLLVEHDREVIAAADYLLDFGPGAGDQGGTITAQGTPKQVEKAKDSLTGQYLSGRSAIPVPTNRRGLPATWKGPEPTREEVSLVSPIGQALSVIGARQHNLRQVDVHFPLGLLVAVTGVSGSGKSSLVHEVLYNTLARRLHRAQTPGGAHEDVLGIEALDKMINVDQDPLGNSPSSNPATYTGVFDLIRELYTRLPESKVRGYTARRFSFNQKGGRCETCEGNGKKKIEMHFLPDVWVECETCRGSRYNPETLAVMYRGYSVSDVLNMRISEALTVFDNIPKIRTILQTLVDVGLGYMALGQPAPTMSGGEAQRVKLAAELARPSTGKTLYLLDEPTTGLHFDDVRKLLEVLQRLVDLGNTVLVVEHNLDVIKSADWVIDMGPEAGVGGGYVVAQGTPEMVVAQAAKATKDKRSHTGEILTKILAVGPLAERVKFDPKAALKAKLDDIDITQVGADEKLPWEADGYRWHTQDRITTKGTACKWSGAALAKAIELVEAAGTFSATNWNTRSVVEVAAETKSQGWFLHAMTGHEAYFLLCFRVARNSFKPTELRAKLGLKPLSDIPGLENYSRQERVEVAQRRGPWQEVVVSITSLAEVESPAFAAFIQDAAKAFAKNLERMKTSVESVMPWKLNGEAWHTGPKGFPPGKTPKWELPILKKLIALIRELEPDIDIKWDSQDSILLKLPGIGRSWARWKTKDPAALELRFVGQPSQFNQSRLEGIGNGSTLTPDPDADIMLLRFLTTTDLALPKLKKLFQDHATGFRKTFGEG
ncbi:MAG: excinuclease ABC subunit UvrA [Fimbriiglobus sp.]